MKTINKKCRTKVDCNVAPSCATLNVAMPKNSTTDNWKKFGLWIVQKRDELGMRQEDLAEKIGKDRQTVYRIEKGSGTKRPTVIKIAEALHQKPGIALDIAFGIPESQNGTEQTGADLDEPRKFIESILRRANNFHDKGYTEQDIEDLLPYYKILKDQLDRKEGKRKS